MTAPVAHRVLVVDDEPGITALVAYHLAKAGYRVATSGNGREALRPPVTDVTHPPSGRDAGGLGLARCSTTTTTDSPRRGDTQ